MGQFDNVAHMVPSVGTEVLTPFQDTLIRLRELAGLTQRQLAARCGASHSSVNRWELGHGLPKRDNVGQLDKAMDGEGTLLAAWRLTTEGTGLPEWARDLESIERSARSLSIAAPALVPGYLQCAGLARKVFRNAQPLVGSDELDRLVALRTNRLRELEDVEVTAVFPVSAVSALSGDLAAEQANYLIDWVNSGRVAVHLVPENALLLGPASPLMLFRFGSGEQAVVSDHADGNVIHEDHAHDRLAAQVTVALAASLPLSYSLEALRDLT